MHSIYARESDDGSPMDGKTESASQQRENLIFIALLRAQAPPFSFSIKLGPCETARLFASDGGEHEASLQLLSGDLALSQESGRLIGVAER